MATTPEQCYRRPHHMQDATPGRVGDGAGACDGAFPQSNVLGAGAANPILLDAPAFEDVYRRHSRAIYGLCLRIVRNRSDAEDLVQEAFLRAFRKRHQFQGRAAFSTWLHRVAFNEALMWLRKNARLPSSLEESRGGDEAVKVTDRWLTEDSRLSGTHDRLALEAALCGLSARNREVITLYDIEGYRHKEIARLRQCSVSSSKASLRRARKKLRELLGRGNFRKATKRLSKHSSRDRFRT